MVLLEILLYTMFVVLIRSNGKCLQPKLCCMIASSAELALSPLSFFSGLLSIFEFRRPLLKTEISVSAEKAE